MTARSKPVQMCCVSIGFQAFLMPVEVGMKMVSLLGQAMSCDKQYDAGGWVFYVEEQPRVEFVTVRPDQIRCRDGVVTTPAPGRRKTLLLGSDH